MTIVFDPYDPVPNQEPGGGEWNRARKWIHWEEYGKVIPIATGGAFTPPADFKRHSLDHYLDGCYPIYDWDPNYDPFGYWSSAAHWRKTGSMFNLQHRINQMAAASDGYLLICHSQGCNILMQMLKEGCDDCPKK